MVDEFNNRLPIAEVVWEDAWIDPKDISMEDAVKLMPIIRSTVGYVVSKENAENVVNEPRKPIITKYLINISSKVK